MKIKLSLFHLRDIILLPGMVTILIPLWIYKETPESIPDYLSVKLLAIITCCTGIILVFWTIYLFHTIGKGTLAPWSSKEKLIVEGPYQYCRNPMITGVLFILIGEAFWFRSLPILVWALTFFIINTCYFILSEEPFLEQKFGDAYRVYKSKVPRWIPKWIKKID